MKAWYMSECDSHGNPVGQRKNITDAVLDTAGEETFNAQSGEQEMAAQAIAESEYGVKDGYMLGTYWTE